MYAIVRTGGFQYQVEPGAVVALPRMEADIGAMIDLPEVLLVSDEGKVQVGRPTLAGAKVTVKVLRHTRGPKIVVGRHKRRKHYDRKLGHRQDYTQVRVAAISLP
ncbi:50S ribosomal protein L21 [bacterium]|nr:50S ribosomal protein L21 [bacterium]